MSAPPADRTPRPPIDAVELQRAQNEARARMFGTAERTRMGRYVLGRRLGSGSWGTVYRAFDPSTQRDVALKVLHADVAGDDAEQARRRQREARALAALASPGIIAVFDAGWAKQRHYIVTELVPDAMPLDAWVLQHEPSWTALLELLDPVFAALVHAHAAGIVHCDVKPANILVSAAGSAQLADFGLARLRPRGHGEAVITSQGSPDRSSAFASKASSIAGTPAFMAPEVRAGQPPSPRSDQYSLSVSIAWLLASGHSPPSAAVHRVLCRGQHEDPEQRFGSVDDLWRAIGKARRRRRIWPVLAAGCAAGLLVFAAVPHAAPACAVPVPSAGLWTWSRDDAYGRFVRAWRTRAADVCSAEFSPDKRDALRDCLARHDATVTALRRSEVATPLSSADLDHALEGMARAGLCETDSAAAPTVALRPYERVDRMINNGEHERVEAELERLGLSDTAEGLLLWGRSAGHLNRGADARAALTEAFVRADLMGQEALALRAAAELASVFAQPYFADADKDGARRWIRQAESLRARIGGPYPIETGLALASAHAELDERAQARALFAALRTQAVASADAEQVRRVDSASRVREGLWAMHDARWEDAVELWTAVVESSTKRHGPRAVVTLSFRTNLGGALVRAGEYQRATEVLEEVLKAREALWGVDDRRLATTAESLALALANLGEHARAIGYQRRAVALYASAESGQFTATALSNLGALQMLTQDFEGAAASMNRALVELEALDTATATLARTNTLMGLSQLAIKRGEPTQALTLAERAHGLAVSHFGRDHAQTKMKADWLESVRETNFAH